MLGHHARRLVVFERIGQAHFVVAVFEQVEAGAWVVVDELDVLTPPLEHLRPVRVERSNQHVPAVPDQYSYLDSTCSAAPLLVPVLGDVYRSRFCLRTLADA